jgi:hypothetical protein
MSSMRWLGDEELRLLYAQDGNDFSEQADHDTVRMLIREVLWRRHAEGPMPAGEFGHSRIPALWPARVDLDHVDALPPEAT